MINIKEKKNCCGCEACAQICPKHCIRVVEDREGFWYPETDLFRCSNCGVCEKVCPVINKKEGRNPIKVLGVKNSNEKIRLNSSSGGMFSIFAEEVINLNGVVFGARFNDKWEVVHDFTTSLIGLSDFRGSKYVQSKIGTCYQQVKKFLEDGRWVLFSGTPCQVLGLNLYLRKKHERLITIDFICHGVPSPKVFMLYLIELKHKFGSEIIDIQFRNKDNGWRKYGFMVKFKNSDGELVLTEVLDDNIYRKGFLKDLYLRPSCHFCPSKNLSSSSDITIADFWGIEKFKPEFDDDKGVSLVLLNSAIGEQLLNMVYGKCLFMEAPLEIAQKYNPFLSKSVSENPKRQLFFQRFEIENLNHLIYFLTREPLIVILKSSTKRLIKLIIPKPILMLILRYLWKTKKVTK
jgi:coenzyme F420-reducing hydrogenase beta subunit